MVTWWQREVRFCGFCHHEFDAHFTGQNFAGAPSIQCRAVERAIPNEFDVMDVACGCDIAQMNMAAYYEALEIIHMRGVQVAQW